MYALRQCTSFLHFIRYLLSGSFSNRVSRARLMKTAEACPTSDFPTAKGYVLRASVQAIGVFVSYVTATF